MAHATESTVLVVNAGSSSLKVKLLPQDVALTVERIGGESVIRGDLPAPLHEPLARHEQALSRCLEILAGTAGAADLRIAAVGHRVVHGGERYTEPVLIDDRVVRVIERLAQLAPLHNPANLEGIAAARHRLPDVPHVAVFDTAFHATLPPHAYLTGLPRESYERDGIRNYGFHGTSHDYVTRRAAELLGRAREELRLVSLHLGNGASGTAVLHGRSVDTTMGFTPLAGLLMGTRCGDLDPGIILHLLRGGMGVDELDTLLNRRSGLLGVSAVSNDLRDVRRAAAAGDAGARQALAVFTYRIRKTIGAYAAAMGGLDGVVFTAGIGENDPATRAESLAGLEHLGLHLDPELNRAGGPIITTPDSPAAALVVPTDEEALIADATRAVVAALT